MNPETERAGVSRPAAEEGQHDHNELEALLVEYGRVREEEGYGGLRSLSAWTAFMLALKAHCDARAEAERERISALGFDVQRWSRIFCHECKETLPVLVDELLADERNDHAALDLVCANCRAIVATLHERAVEEGTEKP